jgi:hypothetical protein
MVSTDLIYLGDSDPYKGCANVGGPQNALIEGECIVSAGVAAGVCRRE